MKKQLEIYYTLENINEEISDINEDLYRFITNKYKDEYEIVKFKRYYSKKFYSNIANNIVQKGICVLNEMINYLKFKSPHCIWFIYIADGQTVFNNTSVNVHTLLLNTNVTEQSCYYAIHEQKDSALKFLPQLFMSQNILNYDNVF